jgi:hypothetical protein
MAAIGQANDSARCDSSSVLAMGKHCRPLAEYGNVQGYRSQFADRNSRKFLAPWSRPGRSFLPPRTVKDGATRGPRPS